jgi:hypothetical protein
VQSDEFAAEEVLAWGDALGDGDGLDALVGDEAVDAPFGAVEGVLGNLLGWCVNIFSPRGRKEKNIP